MYLMYVFVFLLAKIPKCTLSILFVFQKEINSLFHYLIVDYKITVHNVKYVVWLDRWACSGFHP